MLKIHEIEGYIQTIYLVEYTDRLLLLDGCCRADVDTICNFIQQQLCRPLTDLKLIVVTHMHPDHAGGAHVLRKRTQAKIATGNAPSHWYRGLDGMLMHLSDMALALWVAKRKNKPKKNLWYSRKLKPDIYLPDNAQLPEFSDWRALHTPGHTDRDISLLHEPSNKIYVADLMVKVKGQLVAPFPVFYPRLYRRSLNRIESLEPTAVILAHHGELTFQSIDFGKLLKSAPKQPMTHWRSVKKKTKRALGF
ncbi:MBL fold metallo-hydrolase [Pseudoalteromonas sp. T1lg65]|uniref:MBL fold metallo-hydrolase n=1 Tax=Pseudoalteromonas sp. T1lg65 TaxID=2077101 RepID=UPI003F79AC06